MALVRFYVSLGGFAFSSPGQMYARALGCTSFSEMHIGIHLDILAYVCLYVDAYVGIDV